MWRIFRWLLTGDGHKHKWEYHRAIRGYRRGEYRIPSSVTIIDVCTVCGKTKKTYP